VLCSHEGLGDEMIHSLATTRRPPVSMFDGNSTALIHSAKRNRSHESHRCQFRMGSPFCLCDGGNLVYLPSRQGTTSWNNENIRHDHSIGESCQLNFLRRFKWTMKQTSLTARARLGPKRYKSYSFSDYFSEKIDRFGLELALARAAFIASWQQPAQL
jgi:hypothetical protein